MTLCAISILDDSRFVFHNGIDLSWDVQWDVHWDVQWDVQWDVKWFRQKLTSAFLMEVTVLKWNVSSRLSCVNKI